MAEVAAAAKVPLVAQAGSLDALADLTQTLKNAGVEDLVLDPGAGGYRDSLHQLTNLRRLALKKNFCAASGIR